MVRSTQTILIVSWLQPRISARVVGSATNPFGHHPLNRKCYSTHQAHSSDNSYVHHIGRHPLKYKTLGQILSQTATQEATKNNLAIISIEQNVRYTYDQLLEEADALAAGLIGLGVNRNSRVGIWAPNCAEWIVANMACARAGFVTVAINPAFQSRELEYCVRKVRLSTLICGGDEFYGESSHQRLLKIDPAIEKCSAGGISSVRMPSLRNVILISGRKASAKWAFDFDRVKEIGSQTAQQIANIETEVQPDQPCCIQFTSGTTSDPKAAVISHFSMVNNSCNIGVRNELDQKHHTICVQVPLFHAFGTVISIGSAVNFGSTLVLPSSKYSPSKNLDAMVTHKCSIVHGTPTMYVDLIQQQMQRKEKINAEIAVTGGAPCSAQLIQQIMSALGVAKIKSVFGMSETTAVTFQTLPTDNSDLTTTTVGHVSDHIEAKVVDEHDRVVPFGTAGQLCVRGYTSMLGYFDDATRTKETLQTDGWLKTGDWMILNKNGYGKIVGRIKDMIIRGGENIYPAEIEDVINTHPDVLESQVIGVSNERLGEEVCVCIRPRSQSPLKLDDIRDFCQSKLAEYKIPTQIFVTGDKFPATTSGKIQKYVLKQMVEKHLFK